MAQEATKKSGLWGEIKLAYVRQALLPLSSPHLLCCNWDHLPLASMQYASFHTRHLIQSPQKRPLEGRRSSRNMETTSEKLTCEDRLSGEGQSYDLNLALLLFPLHRENILVLDIFFEVLNYETIEQKKAYEIAGLLGEVVSRTSPLLCLGHDTHPPPTQLLPHSQGSFPLV